MGLLNLVQSRKLSNMNITVLHGGDTVLVERKLREVESKFEGKRIVRAFGKEATGEFVVNNFRGGELFDESKLIIIREPEKNFDVWSLLGEGCELVLVFGGQLSASSKFLKIAGAKVVDLSLPQDRRIFALLDQILDKDKRALRNLEVLLGEFGFQYILTMLFYNLRRLYLRKRLPSYVAKKMDERRKVWERSVASFYEQMLEADYNFKSGLGDERADLFTVVGRMLLQGRNFAQG